MLWKQCNTVVHHVLAFNADDFAQLAAELPACVSADLENALTLEGRVLRYDADSRTAYCLERLSPTLSAWRWDGIDSYDIAASLLSMLVMPDHPIDEATAIDAYERAKAPGLERPRP
jgi:hypothetical protein